MFSRITGHLKNLQKMHQGDFVMVGFPPQEIKTNDGDYGACGEGKHTGPQRVSLGITADHSRGALMESQAVPLGTHGSHGSLVAHWPFGPMGPLEPWARGDPMGLVGMGPFGPIAFVGLGRMSAPCEKPKVLYVVCDRGVIFNNPWGPGGY